jgi:hypothetical protein
MSPASANFAAAQAGHGSPCPLSIQLRQRTRGAMRPQQRKCAFGCRLCELLMYARSPRDERRRRRSISSRAGVSNARCEKSSPEFSGALSSRPGYRTRQSL